MNSDITDITNITDITLHKLCSLNVTSEMVQLPN